MIGMMPVLLVLAADATFPGARGGTYEASDLRASAPAPDWFLQAPVPGAPRVRVAFVSPRESEASIITLAVVHHPGPVEPETYLREGLSPLASSPAGLRIGNAERLASGGAVLEYRIGAKVCLQAARQSRPGWMILANLQSPTLEAFALDRRLFVRWFESAVVHTTDPTPDPTSPSGADTSTVTPARARRVAVLVTGGDISKAGALQRSLEARLSASGVVQVIAVSEIAERLRVGSATTRPMPPPGEGREAFARLLKESQDDYYQGRLLDAVEKLQQLDRMNPARSDRVQVQLWRAAVVLATGDRSRAEKEAQKLLELDPELKVEGLDAFPPSVVTWLKEQQTAAPRRVVLKFDDAPLGASILVDGITAGPRSTVTPGNHRFSVSAPGFRTLEGPIEVPSDLTKSVALPLALPSDIETAIRALVIDNRGPSRSEAKMLEDFALRLGADGLLVAAAHEAPSRISASLWWSASSRSAASGGAMPATAEGEASLAEWAASAVEPTPVSLASDDPAVAPGNKPPDDPNATGEEVVPGPSGRIGAYSPRKRPPTVWEADGGMRVAARERTLTSELGGGYKSKFLGAGPHLAGRVAGGPWVGGLEVSFVSYDGSSTVFTLPSGDQAKARGGSTFGVEVAGGYRFALGARAAGPRPGVAVEVVTGWEQHQAHDLVGPDGPLRMFASYGRTSIGARAGGDVPIAVGRSQAVTLRASLGLSPWSAWTETPSGTTGRSPRGTLAPSWLAGAEWKTHAAWTLSASYDGAAYGADFTGDGKAPLSPPVRDASIQEKTHAFSLTARRSF